MVRIKQSLETEQVNHNSEGIEDMDSLAIATLMNKEDKTVSDAVENQLTNISKAIDEIHLQLSMGGRLVYVGAGTSGRLGVLDASECPPTFGVSSDMVVGVIAGGCDALTCALENVEDSTTESIKALKENSLCSNDIVCGIASSGRTPFVLSALEYAQSLGCITIALSCVKDAQISKKADTAIEVVTGAEVVTGSTRLKAGTATKMVLNMLTTGSMIRLGKVYKGYMVDVQPTNEKLRQRSENIVSTIVECSNDKARALLEETEYTVKEAIIIGLTGFSRQRAIDILDENNQHVSRAIQNVK